MKCMCGFMTIESDTLKCGDKRTLRLAELFIKEEFSLELLLILLDEGPKTICEISEVERSIKDTNGANDSKVNDTNTEKITGILSKLEELHVIEIKNGSVNITSRGCCIVRNLRKKVCENERNIR